MRFSGGRPQDWAALPYAAAIAFRDAIPRLQAREALLAASVAAIGAGRMKPEETAKTLRAWQRQAGYAKPVRVESHAELQERLKGMRVGVVHVPKRRKTADG